jgi:hypothetical protein
MNDLVMEFNPGDKIKCVESNVEGRKGREFTIIAGTLNSKKKPWLVSRVWLWHCINSGDKFEKMLNK